MIDVKKIKKDIVNYGALVIYEWTVVTTAEAEDDELFKASQLKDIFENKFDILKLNVEIVDPETGDVLEVLKNQFMKSNFEKNANTLCYSSAVDSNEKLTKLLFSKTGAEYGVEVQEYAVGEGGGGGGATQLVTWAELKAMRDGALLTPGQSYRITDYAPDYSVNPEAGITYVMAGHAFDIIVTALNESTLSEEAKAINHEGDTYFANNNLAAWKLCYCLDNDTSRFNWANTVDGKGVIYRMIDEFDNECPYDFKNVAQVEHGDPYIVFHHPGPGRQVCYRYAAGDENGYYAWKSAYFTVFTDTETPTTESTLYSDSSGTITEAYQPILEVSDGTVYRYTFGYLSIEYDGSLNNASGKNTVNNVCEACYMISPSYMRVLKINKFGIYVNNNRIGTNSYENKIYNNVENAKIGINCHDNDIGQSNNSSLTYKHIVFENTVSYVILKSTYGQDMSNIRICQGVLGLDRSKIIINHPQDSAPYHEYKAHGSTEVIVGGDE